jgi:catechol 2,3-dioxygenase-like lactoylglutathione lyase family enzyme
LHHVALGARDVEAVASFYRDLMGLRERARHRYEDGALRSVWLELGPQMVLMVEHTEQTRGRVEGVGAGAFLVAFAAGSEQEREELCARLENAGHPVESRTSFTCYLRDPEGNRVAVSIYPL